MARRLRKALVAACDDERLLGLELWPRQRDLLAAVEQGPRMHVWALGRRSGKTLMAALACVWDATLRPELDAMVRPGETRYAVAVATNVRQARLLVAAARSIVERSPVLAGLLESASEDELRLRLPSGARTAVAAFPCSSRGGRGWPISTLIMDEAAHFLSETEGPQVADRVFAALAPSTAQFDGRARVIVCSTPYGPDGLFARLLGDAQDGKLLGAVAQHATTAEMNPTITAEFLAMEEARDPISFRAEYLAELVAAGDAFIDLERAKVGGRDVAPPEAGTGWVCGLDPAFASRGDAFGVALVGESRVTKGELVVGPVLALRPDREFMATLARVADTAAFYGAKVVTDQYSAEAIVDFLRRRRLDVRKHSMSATSKTDVFSELRARLYERTLILPDDPDLLAELRRLQTRFRAGSAAVTNPRVGGSHGDRAQALALATFEHSQGRRGGEWFAVPDGRLVDPSKRVTTRGGLRLVGEHHFDVGPDGERVPPPGHDASRDPYSPRRL
jgi:hypothetical protein